MKQIFKFVFLLMIFVAGIARADLYTAQNVEMSGEGANPVEAKNNAITAGELQAFNQVIIGLVGADNEGFVERPSDDEILGYVRDISILEEKNTATSYWGKMNVRFKERSIQDLLQKNNQNYVKKAPPIYWLIPVWRQGGDVWTLEDENPFYQLLKGQNKLSDFTTMILPNGDVDEVIAVTKALNDQDFSDARTFAIRDRAEQILVVGVEYNLDGSWKMAPESYTGTENEFFGQTVSGVGMQSLMDGWTRLNNKMAFAWQEKAVSNQAGNAIYYARLDVARLSDWHQLEKEFKKMGFLENVTLQGVMPGQLLVRFNYTKSLLELMEQLEKAGWIWVSDSATVGTLKRKDFYENTL